MSANVRCAGYGIGTRTAAGGTPCGWKGERYAMGVLTDEQDRTLGSYSEKWMAAVHEADAKARTAKPCPRCGGRVELIPAEEHR